MSRDTKHVLNFFTSCSLLAHNLKYSFCQTLQNSADSRSNLLGSASTSSYCNCNPTKDCGLCQKQENLFNKVSCLSDGCNVIHCVWMQKVPIEWQLEIDQDIVRRVQRNGPAFPNATQYVREFVM